MLILLATQKLAGTFLGVAGAASAAIALYVVHNIFYASFAYLAGWLADLLPKPFFAGHGLRAGGIDGVGNYFGAAWVVDAGARVRARGHLCRHRGNAGRFALRGTVSDEQHGIAFGVLATVNGVGDFLSSIIVGGHCGARSVCSLRLGTVLVLFVIGAWLVLRLGSYRPRIGSGT